MKLLVIDSDYTYDRENKPVIRLYGKQIDGELDGENSNENNEDIVLHIIGFEPYFYVDNCGLNIFELQKMVGELLKGYAKRIEIVKKFKPIGYQKEKTDMLRIVLFNPRNVPDVRKLLKEKISEISDSFIYEADILFKDRCMIDAGIDGMSVIWFNGCKLENYGINCDKLYICERSDIVVMKDENVLIEY